MQATPWEGLQRTIRFADLCQTAGTYQVALDIMRPNEAVPTVPSSNAAWRMITINSSTPALPSGCPQPPAPMTLALSGTSSMRPYMTCPMTGSLSGGVAPYTWTWSVTGKGGSIVQNSYPNLADVTIRNNDIIVTATVQDGSGNSVQASYPITSNSSVPDVCV